MSNTLHLTDEQLDILTSAMEFIGDGNIGWEALEGYTDLEGMELFEVCQDLKTKLQKAKYEH